MKKLFALSFVIGMFTLASCGSNNTTAINIADSTAVDSTVTDSVAAAPDSASEKAAMEAATK